MNENKYFEGKQELIKEIGIVYPQSREDLTPRFLIDFANFIPGPDEDDYDDYREYEKAKYASEQWAFIWKITPAISMMDDGETGKAAWEGFLDWVIETYFPEFACK